MVEMVSWLPIAIEATSAKTSDYSVICFEFLSIIWKLWQMERNFKMQDLSSRKYLLISQVIIIVSGTLIEHFLWKKHLFDFTRKIFRTTEKIISQEKTAKTKNTTAVVVRRLSFLNLSLRMVTIFGKSYNFMYNLSAKIISTSISIQISRLSRNFRLRPKRRYCP